MAQKKKFGKEVTDKFVRKENKRQIGSIPKREFYLIVCEGEKTEPNYFESLKNYLYKGQLNIKEIKIEGTGKNTVSIIKEANKIRDKENKNNTRPHIDHVWAVFDRDSFPPVNFNNAINQGENSKKQKVNCAWTNEAFELWYLLHFGYFNTGMRRDQYKKKLEEQITKAGKKNFKYYKNANNIYNILKEYGSLDLAIKNAQKLENSHNNNDYSEHNPCTKVHKLILELLPKESVSENDKYQYP